jgi:hypothetical protein
MTKSSHAIIGVVAALLLIPLAYAAVGYARKLSKSREPFAMDPCIANLKQIVGATEMWALEHHKSTNDVPTWSDLVGPLQPFGSQPSCRLGGTYTLRPVGQKPTCTVPGHSLTPSAP